MGVDNRSPGDVPTDGGASYLEGVFIGSEGGDLVGFGGLHPILDGNMHSGFTTSAGVGFCIRDGVFGSFDGETFRGIIPTSGLAAYSEGFGRTYVLLREGLYYLDGGDVPLVRAGIRRPDPPQVGSVGGRLTPGRYGVAISVVSPGGEESPLSEVVFAEVDGGVVLRGLPDIGELSFRVYITEPDGEELFTAIPSIPNTPTIVVNSPAKGAPAIGVGLDRFEGGDHLCIHGGRIVTAAGTTVLFSEAGDPHKRSMAYGFVNLGAEISFLLSVEKGVLVGTTEGVFILEGADIIDAKLSKIFDSPPIARSALPISDFPIQSEELGGGSLSAVWVDKFGFVGYTDVGDAIRLSGDRIILDPISSIGESHIISKDGRELVVNLVESARPVGNDYGIQY